MATNCTTRTRRWRYRALGLALTAAMVPLPAAGQPPGSNPAVNQPDRFAWELFTLINRPANVTDRNLVEWQTWIGTFNLYGDPCATPTWPEPPKYPRLHPSGLGAVAMNHFPSHTSPFDPSEREQVKLNRPAFEYLVAKKLWFTEGVLLAAVNDAIDFPEDAVIVKSNWKAIDESEKRDYHWQVIQDAAGGLQLVGLNAFHVISKALPRWFWSTFEHVDNPGRCDSIGCRDRFGYAPAYVPPQREPGRLYPAEVPSPELTEMFKAAGLHEVWNNYRLKGTQIDFTDAVGRPTLLGNSVLEPHFEATSSCMTCHTRASVSNNSVASAAGQATPTTLSVLASFTPVQGHVGAPDPAWFQTSHAAPPLGGADIVWRTDFLWELTRLFSREEKCGSGGAAQP